MKKVLVTGASGFVGRHVCRYLHNSGFEVHGLGHGIWLEKEYNKWGIHYWQSCDLTLKNLHQYGQKPDVIVHCCGAGTVSLSIQHPWLDFVNNVSTVASILDYIVESNFHPILIQVSSAAVYGTVDSLPINESVSIFPQSLYGVHKVAAEDLCRHYSRIYEIPTAIVRLFSVYGCGLKKQILWDASNKIMNKDLKFIGTGDEVRDFIHVDDVARLISRLIEYANPKSPVINGGAGQSITIRNVIEKLTQEYGCEEPFDFSGASRACDPPGYLADITLAESLDWRPEVNIDQGIHEYTKWFKEQHR